MAALREPFGRDSGAGGLSSRFIEWLEKHSTAAGVWYVKRLSRNDTSANQSHQAGPYIPKRLLFQVFPALKEQSVPNPRVRFVAHIDSHAEQHEPQAIWYDNKFRGGTRDETRLTGFGGRGSAFLDPSNTGALTVFAFRTEEPATRPACNVWICRDPREETLAEDCVGPVEPGTTLVRHPGSFLRPAWQPPEAEGKCWLAADQIPPEWLKTFPDCATLIRKTVELRPRSRGEKPDRRLMSRRACEYDLFRSVEEAVELPLIREGFSTIDEFIGVAQRILQRRKSRSGRSLELHVREILLEEGLQENRDFAHGPITQAGKRPDFLFPSEAAYRDSSFPPERLRMLAVKTTCKDRWRQILNEADRVHEKHLLTLQEGVSTNQFREMREANVTLVVPRALRRKYPDEARPQIQTLTEFIEAVRPSGVPSRL